MSTKFAEGQIAEFKEAFEIFDQGGKGLVSINNAGLIIRAVGQNPTDKQISKYQRKLDPKKSGWFDWNAFIKLLNEIWDDQSDHQAQIIEAFHVFDEDASGAISAAEFKHVMTNLGEKLTEKEINNIFNSGDVDHDGQIDFDEFVKLMQ